MRSMLRNRKLIWGVLIWAIYLAIPSSPLIAMPSTSLSSMSSEWREGEIKKIMDVLAKPEARAHLVMAGIQYDGLENRLEKLSDQQLREVASKADAVKAAGDAGLAILVSLLVVVILIIIIVMLLDKDVEIKDK